MKIVLVMGAILLVSCSAGRADHKEGRLKLPQITLGAGAIELQHWLLFGPFEAKPGEAALEVDFLATLGTEEAKCRPNEIEEWGTVFTAVAKGRPSARSVDAAVVDFRQHFGSRSPEKPSPPQTAAYAACEIIAEKEGEGWLLLGSDDGAKVWLNGRLLYVCPDQRELVPNEDAIRLQLQRGANLLLIKVTNINGRWSMCARFDPDALSAVRTALEGNGAILKRALIPEGERLELRRGVPTLPGMEVQLESYDRTVTRSLRIEAGSAEIISELPGGLYRVSLDLGTRRQTQKICLGGLEEIYTDLAAKCERQEKRESDAINFETLLRMLEVAKRPLGLGAIQDESIKRTMVAHQEKIVIYAASEIEDALLRLEGGEEAFRNRTGLHLRGFRSSVDDQVLNYRLFVPSGYRADGAGLPLVIVTQTVFARSVPYLESGFAANIREAMEWSEVAEKNGVGILWPGYRICPYGNPADLAHLDEVLAAVSSDYRLDASRLYLYGFCSGGLTAAMEAVRNPRRYAAIACVNPVLHRVKNRFDDDGSFDGWPAYQAWLQATDPVLPLAEIGDLPIWIIHDGMDPGHGPVSHSVDLVEHARTAGNKVRFQYERGRSIAESPLDVFERQLNWLAQQRRTDFMQLTFAADNRRGPLSRIFAERFILVEATDGSVEDQAANGKLSAEFQNAWRRTNYGPCRVIRDRDLSREEERRSHLVLLGNARTNRVWHRIAAQLPVIFTQEGITIDGRSFTGRALALQAWFPHPDQPGKKVALLGGANLREASFGTLELALDGWFDYAIWDNESAQPRLVEAERYREPTAK